MMDQVQNGIILSVLQYALYAAVKAVRQSGGEIQKGNIYCYWLFASQLTLYCH